MGFSRGINIPRWQLLFFTLCHARPQQSLTEWLTDEHQSTVSLLLSLRNMTFPFNNYHLHHFTTYNPIYRYLAVSTLPHNTIHNCTWTWPQKGIPFWELWQILNTTTIVPFPHFNPSITPPDRIQCNQLKSVINLQSSYVHCSRIMMWKKRRSGRWDGNAV